MPVRHFVDRDGIEWDVWHTVPSKPSFVPPAYAEGWLAFSSPGERRRLAPVPVNWETASDQRLDLYCRAAEPVAG